MGNAESQEFFDTIVEIDETYVGGKPRRSSKDDDAPKETGICAKRGHGTNKTPVIAIIDHNNKKVIAKVAMRNGDGQKLTATQLIDILKTASKQQKCVVHQIRNSIRYVSYKDTKKLLANLKMVYTAPTEDAALSALEEFEKIWGTRYPLVVQSWRRNWGEIATFFKYSPEIRKLIYTTNMIESYHRQLRKVTKGKSIFPNDESLLKMLYLVTRDVMLKWTGRIHNWGQILFQLSVFFPERVKSFLQ